MNKPKIIITGSEGTIGTVLCPSLANQYQIVRTDKADTSGQNFHRADVSDFDSIKTVFGENAGTEYVIHLAASSLVDTGWEETLRNNIIGTRNVYECARLFGIKKVIYTSSNHVTGGYEGIPPELHTKNSGVQISVDDPVRPDSDYGSSKVYGEAVARQYYELHGIRSICLRIGTVTADDDPAQDPSKRMFKTWLSHRDMVQLFRKSLETDRGFGIYYGVSENKGRFWNIENARSELGYQPVDDASDNN